MASSGVLFAHWISFDLTKKFHVHLDLAELMEDRLHHPQWFIILSTPSPDFLHTKDDKEFMNRQKKTLEVQFLHTTTLQSMSTKTEASPSTNNMFGTGSIG